MKRQLEGMVAIVTGAGRGFGKAIAARFAAEGAAVAVTARSRAQLDATVTEIEAAGGRALALPGDCTSRADVVRIVMETRREFGPVGLLVNNAGVPGPFGPLGVVDPDEWWRSQEVHIRAPLLFVSAVLPGMIERGGGRVVIVSAKGSHLVAPNMSAYCLGKAAQTRLTQLIAAEGRERGIIAFAIDPGFVVTQLAEDTMGSPDAQRWLPGMIERLKSRKGEPGATDDLARCAQRCLDLASGRYDGLSGRYMELHHDLDGMLKEAATS